ncbi:hypothetical protein BKK51_12205 [Rodentibacter trehalosifermentans]|uniref:Uncharacterized protein n=1 Tax=Rodentibacter trehalosifermentans TaxID=1908263 RepID=A0A1V3ILW6_9PAST|nr:hypothetical protein [Rodentibacter trehalosifermentans]OOF43038.1 hypothetical protein BKK51_12205 [Rodentibacter trehalosifermentans]
MSKFAKELKKRLADFREGQGKAARVGVIAQQHYNDETPVAYVAAIHEYGSESNNIKPRPFFRPTISENRKSGGILLKNY